jgi:hypothetical protein
LSMRGSTPMRTAAMTRYQNHTSHQHMPHRVHAHNTCHTQRVYAQGGTNMAPLGERKGIVGNDSAVDAVVALVVMFAVVYVAAVEGVAALSCGRSRRPSNASRPRGSVSVETPNCTGWPGRGV